MWGKIILISATNISFSKSNKIVSILSLISWLSSESKKERQKECSVDARGVLLNPLT